MDGHDFEHIDGRWRCVDEDVDADECTDYERCNFDCVCNDKDE